MNTASITCVGNVTADPTLEYTNNGHAKLKFSVACNRSWKKGEEWVEETSFINCIAWRQLAEDTAAVIEKGVGAVVVGRMDQRTWEDDEGNKRSVYELVADTVAIQCRNIEEFTRKRFTKQEGASSGSAPSPRAKQKEMANDPF